MRRVILVGPHEPHQVGVLSVLKNLRLKPEPLGPASGLQVLFLEHLKGQLLLGRPVDHPIHLAETAYPDHFLDLKQISH
jgi:hypothetical protein